MWRILSLNLSVNSHSSGDSGGGSSSGGKSHGGSIESASIGQKHIYDNKHKTSKIVYGV